MTSTITEFDRVAFEEYQKQGPLHLGTERNGFWVPLCGGEVNWDHSCWDPARWWPTTNDAIDGKCPGCGRPTCMYCLLLAGQKETP